MDTPKTVTHVSLCAGYGGIDLGLKRAVSGLRTIAVSEIEAFACANLVAKMEAGFLDPAPIWTNVKTFPWEQFRGKVDILSGGYPCQPFSAAGKRLGKDDPRHLWPWIADGIRICQPGMCFFENVEGHISLGLRDVIGELEEIGYRTTWGIFSASEVGAPHQRKRVFILAYCASTGLEGLRAYAGQSLKPEFGDSYSPFWPSRPGQPQFAWEPPRVVANAERGRGKEPGIQQAGLPAKSSGSDSQSVVDAKRVRRSEAERDAGGMGKTECAEEGSESQFGYAASTINGGSSVVGHAAKLLRNGGDDNAGSGERCETISEFGDTSGEASMGDTESERSTTLRSQYEGFLGKLCAASSSGQSESDGRKAQPALGRDADGPASRLDYAELCVSCDNRTDELRLLGNGVVPATAEHAFRTLIARFLSQ